MQITCWNVELMSQHWWTEGNAVKLCYQMWEEAAGVQKQLIGQQIMRWL